MATLLDIGVSAGVNISSAVVFLLAFALLRLQPANDRIYFTKWYMRGLRTGVNSTRAINRFVNLNWRSYVRVLHWTAEALRMPEAELIEHAGLDSVVFLRIYWTALKIFFPVTILAIAVLVPVNYTNNTLESITQLQYSDIDKLSISNIPPGSHRFWAHILMTYAFSYWICYVLLKEYEKVAAMRLQFIASEKRHPDEFTVLVRNVPLDPDESIGDLVEHFFLVNHPDTYLSYQSVYDANNLVRLVELRKKKNLILGYYLLRHSRSPGKRPTTKTGFLGCGGEEVDAIDFYTEEINRLQYEIAQEHQRVKTDPLAIMPAAFVSFKTRWGAAVCAQTQQSRNPVNWSTDWAPEPRDVFWPNVAIPYVHRTVRKCVVSVIFFFLTMTFMIPIAFVQSLANIEGLEKKYPFLSSVIEVEVIKSFIQGFLPGFVLKIFLLILPRILMALSRAEGLICVSIQERRAAARFYLFNFVNTFLASIISGTAFEQLTTFLELSANQVPKTIGVAVPMKATFFITYIMVDGWAGIAGEILRLSPLIIYHVKTYFLVRTERDKEEAMSPGGLEFHAKESQIQFFIFLGLVYAVVTPILLPFILIFFAFAYVIYRHQIINVYHQEYESAASFWPDVHRRIMTGLGISQILLMGLLSTKQASQSTPFLILLPFLTLWFYKFSRGRFEAAFATYPLEDAVTKDTLDRVKDPYYDIRAFLDKAYLHPVFKELGEGGRPNERINLDNAYINPVFREVGNENSPLAIQTQGQEHDEHEGHYHSSQSSMPLGGNVNAGGSGSGFPPSLGPADHSHHA